MKRFFVNTLLVAFAAITMSACKSFNTLSSGETAQGRPYELILVCGQPQWQSELGDTLRYFLQQPVAELPTYEPMFDVMRIMPNNFKSLTKTHRNIVVVNVDKEFTEPSISVRYNVTAKPQVFVTIKGPDTESVAAYVGENGNNIVQVLEKAERDRTIAYAQRYASQPLKELIRNTFGVEMNISDDYKLRTQSPDMVWISQEFPTASQGFFIYKYPYEGEQSLSAKALVKARNRFASRIPGPKEGSYMTTVNKIPDETGLEYIPYTPEYRTMRIGSQPWIEMVGLWDVENYFMGGPYVSYTTVNSRTNEVITIDCYVYSPKVEKRNMLRELQALVHLIDFNATDTDMAAEQ
ncbi:MAG: DUF4837 family protein [Rikenellaceae bacterium]|nr:DUF4837 family protein [Rikenellaceae bacterium]